MPPQHPPELLGRHRPAGPLAPLGLGTCDVLGAQALVEAALPVGLIDG
jgi:hypothetical protein